MSGKPRDQKTKINLADSVKNSNAKSISPVKVNKNEKSDKRKSKDKLPAGLALMHGFSANNVGKQRLTVRLRGRAIDRIKH